MRCTKRRQPVLNENFNLPYGSHVKKHDTRLLIGRIAFLTCGKSDTRHLIRLHRFANENLLCGFSVCESQYVYNKKLYHMLLKRGKRVRSAYQEYKWPIRPELISGICSMKRLGILYSPLNNGNVSPSQVYPKPLLIFTPGWREAL